MFWYNLIQFRKVCVDMQMKDLCININGSFNIFKYFLLNQNVLNIRCCLLLSKMCNRFGAVAHTNTQQFVFSIYLVILSMTVLSLVSVSAGNSFCTISLTNWSLIPGLARSANSKAFFNSSMASVLCEVSPTPLLLYWCRLCNYKYKKTWH